MKKNICLLIILLQSFFLFSQIKSQKSEIEVLSPREGVWANKQMLVINVDDDDSEYFYSLNGYDPEISGFAYDGPVLIDMTGDIKLRIAKLSGGKKEINFSVKPLNSIINKSDFIQSFYDSGKIDYVCGTNLEIPENFEFCFPSTDEEVFIKGRTIKVSENNSFNQKLPCILFDQDTNVKYCFIINVIPEVEGLLYEKDVPFKIQNWTQISFINQNFIYRIDKNYWSGFDKLVEVNRSIPHIIYWQDINYNKNNPIYSFYLPPKPVIEKKESDDGSIVFAIIGDDSYTLNVKNYAYNIQSSLYKEIGVDTFPGNSIQDDLIFNLYSDSVYQGTLYHSFNISKNPPEIPQIASSQSFISKNSVDLEIRTQSENSLFYSVSEALDLELPYSINENNISSLDFKMPDFKNAENSCEKIKLVAANDQPVAYKINAYSQNTISSSKILDYYLIVEPSVYFVNENSHYLTEDGSKKYPFKNLQNCLNNISETDNVKIKILGNVHVTESLNINKTVELLSEDESQIIFENNSNLTIIDSKLKIKNLIFAKYNETQYLENFNFSLINIDNSFVEFENCLFTVALGKNGTLSSINNSNLIFSNNICSVSADNYSNFITGVKSSVSIQNSKIHVNGFTSVGLNLTDCNLDLNNNDFKVSGNIGRICEIINSSGLIKNNFFKCQLSNISKSSAIYCDEKSLLEDYENEYFGF